MTGNTVNFRVAQNKEQEWFLTITTYEATGDYYRLAFSQSYIRLSRYTASTGATTLIWTK